MRVRIERYGGVVGRPAVGEREEAELSPAARAALRRLLAAPPKGPSAGAASGPPGQMRYKIRVEDDHGVREIEVPEADMPDELAEIPEVKL